VSFGIATPDRPGELLATDPEEGGRVTLRGQTLTLHGGILRTASVGAGDQSETQRTFAYKWSRRETFELEESSTERALVDATAAGRSEVHLPPMRPGSPRRSVPDADRTRRHPSART
jgi:hypothetical protein